MVTGGIIPLKSYGLMKAIQVEQQVNYLNIGNSNLKNIMELKIEKGIPIPARGLGRIPKYPEINEMEMGDSIAFPFEIERKICAFLSKKSKLFGVKFVSRARIENEKKVLRVWRVK